MVDDKPQSLLLTDPTDQHPAYRDLEKSSPVPMSHMVTHSHWCSSTRPSTAQGLFWNTRSRHKLERRLESCRMNFWLPDFWVQSNREVSFPTGCPTVTHRTCLEEQWEFLLAAGSRQLSGTRLHKSLLTSCPNKSSPAKGLCCCTGAGFHSWMPSAADTQP